MCRCQLFVFKRNVFGKIEVLIALIGCCNLQLQNANHWIHQLQSTIEWGLTWGGAAPYRPLLAASHYHVVENNCLSAKLDIMVNITVKVDVV